MTTIETTATVSQDGTLEVRVHVDLPPGTHRVVLNVEDQPGGMSPVLKDFPVIHIDRWPAGLSLHREDMYDDWGR